MNFIKLKISIVFVILLVFFLACDKKLVDPDPFDFDKNNIIYSATPDIFILNIESKENINLTNDSNIQFMPKFSPDGSKIIYAASSDDGNNNIWIMKNDGTGKKQLTFKEQCLPLFFTADGERIFYSSYLNGKREIFNMDAEGNNHINLSSDPSWSNIVASYIDISPDGSFLIFKSIVDTDKYLTDIYRCNIDGNNLTNITNSEGQDTQPVITPDGMKVIFKSTRAGNSEIYSMDVDGNNLLNLTKTPDSDEYLPRVTPNELYIVFGKTDGTSSSLSKMRMDGSDETNFSVNGLYWVISDNSSQIVYTQHPETDLWSIWSIGIDGSNNQKLIEIKNEPGAVDCFSLFFQPGK